MPTAALADSTIHLKNQLMAMAILAVAFLSRWHAAHAGVDGQTAITVDVLFTITYFCAYLSIVISIYLGLRARAVPGIRSVGTPLPTTFTCASGFSLAAATGLVHYKAMGIAFGATLAVLFIASSSAVRAFGNALVELCARLRCAVLPPSQDIDAEGASQERRDGEIPPTA